MFCVNINPAGNLIVTGSYDETVRLWDMKTGKCVRTLNAHSDPVSAVEFNIDGTLIVSSAYDGLCRVWDTTSGRCLKTLYCDKTSPVAFARFSPNSKYVISSSLDSTLRLWELGEKVSCVRTFTGHQNSKYCAPVSFLSNSSKDASKQATSSSTSQPQLIAGASEDGRILIWDIGSQQLIQQWDAHSGAVLSFCSHPTKRLIVSSALTAPYEFKLWYDTSYSSS